MRNARERQKQVLGFDVRVHDVLLLEEGQRAHDLKSDLTQLIQRNATLLVPPLHEQTKQEVMVEHTALLISGSHLRQKTRTAAARVTQNAGQEQTERKRN